MDTPPQPGGVEELPEPATLAPGPGVAAAARQLRRRDRWHTLMLSFLILIVVTSGGYLTIRQGDSQQAPRWLLGILIALGVLATAAGLIMRRQEMALDRLSDDVRSRALLAVGPRHPVLEAVRLALGLGLLILVGLGLTSVLLVLHWSLSQSGP
jgi:hypothetical protein